MISRILPAKFLRVAPASTSLLSMNILHLQNTLARPVAGVALAAGDKLLFAGGSGGYDVWSIAAQSHSSFASRNVGLYFG